MVKSDCAREHSRDGAAHTLAKTEFIRAVTITFAITYLSQEHPHDRS